MKVYLLEKVTYYDDYPISETIYEEKLGVFSTREGAEKRAKELSLDFDDLVRYANITEFELDK